MCVVRLVMLVAASTGLGVHTPRLLLTLFIVLLCAAVVCVRELAAAGCTSTHVARRTYINNDNIELSGRFCSVSAHSVHMQTERKRAAGGVGFMVA